MFSSILSLVGLQPILRFRYKCKHLDLHALSWRTLSRLRIDESSMRSCPSTLVHVVAVKLREQQRLVWLLIAHPVPLVLLVPHWIPKLKPVVVRADVSSLDPVSIPLHRGRLADGERISFDCLQRTPDVDDVDSVLFQQLLALFGIRNDVLELLHGTDGSEVGVDAEGWSLVVLEFVGVR